MERCCTVGHPLKTLELIENWITEKLETLEGKEPRERVARWALKVHPRGSEIFGGSSGVREVLQKLSNFVPDNAELIDSKSCECILWQGALVDNYPVIFTKKPNSKEESLTFVSRILVFLFATDGTFERFIVNPQQMIATTCSEPRCVNLAHIVMP